MSISVLNSDANLSGKTLLTAENDETVDGLLTFSQGIAFPAVQNPSVSPNTLDDYEEGTFTFSDGSGAGLSITTVFGNYTKIGRLVHVEGQFVYPATASGANAQLSGLPFTASSGGGLTPGFSSLDIRLYVIGASQTFMPLAPTTNTQQTNLQMSAANVLFSGTYMTA